MLDAAPDAFIVIDRRGSVVALNPQAERLLGWTEAELLGGPIERLISPHFHLLYEARRTGEDEPPGLSSRGAPLSLSASRRDGTEVPVELRHSRLGPGGDGFILVTIRDLTEWRRAQQSVFQEKEHAVNTLESIGDALITTDAAGIITYLNPVAERLTGWRATEALGQPLDAVFVIAAEATGLMVESTALRCLEERRAVDLAEGMLLLRRDGTEVAIGDSAAPIHDRSGAISGVVLVFHDVTERRRVARRLSHDATHDALTGLVNRKEFERRLTRVVADAAEAPAGAEAEHVLCYLDLDRFKLVNDHCGHEAGDDLLRKIAKLLGDRMRRRDTLARLGGDEFAAILEHCSLARAAVIADELRLAVAEFRFVWEAKAFSLGASIGVIPIARASGPTATVMRAADTACFAAKDAGGNRVHVGLLQTARQVRKPPEPRLGARLAQALKESLFQLYAQPIIALAPQHPPRAHSEILLRLPDESGAVRPAAAFLPQAERYNLMPAIDRWVVGQSVALLGTWHRDNPECELPLCAINLSASSLDDEALVPDLKELLAEHRLPAETLCFELTEAAALGNLAQASRLVSQLRGIGCGVALEDFGHGLSSFAALKVLPVDFLKVAGRYIDGVATDPVYGTLVGAVSRIGRLVGMATVAGQVETKPILEAVRNLELGYAQGYALAKPQPLLDPKGAVDLPRIRRSA